jgi:hypothetical protein
MFKGVIHANARAILPEFIKKMPKRVVNICSGNFTLETTLRLNGFNGRLEGCDISLYTSALGNYFAGQDMTLEFSKDVPEELIGLAKFLKDPCGKAAVVAVCLDLTEHAPRKNPFQQRMWNAAAKQIEKLVEKTMVRLKEKKAIVQLDEFHSRDGVQVIVELNKGDTLVMSSPPTYEKGYEKLYATLMSWFRWDAPSYTDIGPREAFAKLIKAECPSFMLFTEDRDPAVEAVLKMSPKAQAARGPNKNVYLYSTLDVSPKLVRRKVECAEEPAWPRLKDVDTITEKAKVTFHRVNFKEANYFRQVYSSVIPAQASAQYCYVFAIDGKVFGQVMLSIATYDPKFNGQSIAGEYLYMMSDLPVSSEKHPRLAKLVLACTLAKEFQQELEHRTTQKVNWIFTTAFSPNPVSMKYRGVYEFHSRKEKDANGNYSINYVGQCGQKTMRQLFMEWFQKHYTV